MSYKAAPVPSEGPRTLFLDVLNDASKWEGLTQNPGLVLLPGRHSLGEEDVLGDRVVSSSGSNSRVSRGSGTMGGYNFVNGGMPMEKLLGPGEYKYEVTVIGAVERTESSRVFRIPRTFVSYVIKVKRLPDGVSSVVSKRYSAIRALVNDLMEQGLIEKSSLQSFPKKDIRHGNKVGGELVARRQKELLNFFQLLFMHHPKLWESETVKAFMDLHLLTSGEHFLEAELQHQRSEHESSQALTKAAVREAEKAKSGLQQSMSGVTTPPNEVISQICSMGFREDEARAALATAGNDPSLAVEIILEKQGVVSSMNSVSNQQSHQPRNHVTEPVPDLLSAPIPYTSTESQPTPASQVISRAPGDENRLNDSRFRVSFQPHNVYTNPRSYKYQQPLENSGSAGPGTVDI